MSGNKDNERVMIFIDLRNVLKGTKRFRELGTKIDFEDMVEYIADGRDVVGTYVFDGTRVDGLYDGIHYELLNIGFRVIARISYEKEIKVQKEVDAAMSCKMVSQAYEDTYDVAVIVSGDRDFRPAMEQIQELGKKVEVAGFSDNMSWMLARSCDGVHDLDLVPMFYYAPETKVCRKEPVLTTTDRIIMPYEALAF